ncbi:tRNA methyltransferase 1 isoform X1 [Rhodnius prolixus]
MDSEGNNGHPVGGGTRTIIREGKVEVIVENTSKVFYNPVQEFNRDLSILVLTVFAQEIHLTRNGKKRTLSGMIKGREDGSNVNGSTSYSNSQEGISIFEALSATGLRSIRFALEVPGVTNVIANDISLSAVKSIEANIKHNRVDHVVTASHSDASLYMYMNKANGNYFDVVDLDPYGCPSRFLDGAVQVLNDGGLLMVTCTDMAVLAGNSPETCYLKYGATSLRTYACHEMSLRIALQCVASHANRYGRYIVPLLCISVDFYIRLFVKIFTSPATCKETTSKLSHVIQCVGCKSVTLHPLGIKENRTNKPPKFTLPHISDFTKCPHCHHRLQMGGPIWHAPMHDKYFVAKMLSQLNQDEAKFSTSKRIIGMLTLVNNELDIPLYLPVDQLCAKVHCNVIPLLEFRSALLNAGYHVSETHAMSNCVKTDAPMSVIWDIIRIWVKERHPVSANRLDKDDVMKNILEKVSTTTVNFNHHQDAPLPSSGLLRFQMNPTANWGPGIRGSSNSNSEWDVNQEKRKSKQNKKKQKAQNENNSLY